MMWGTHAAFGLLAALVWLSVFNPVYPIIFVAIVVVSSSFPDIDHEGSKINNVLPVTKWFAKFFKHRGFFHSVWPALLLYVAFWYAGLEWVGVAVALGYMTHLFSDGLTKMGVNLLHPVAKLNISGFVETGGVWETIILVLVITAVAVKLWWMI